MNIPWFTLYYWRSSEWVDPTLFQGWYPDMCPCGLFILPNGIYVSSFPIVTCGDSPVTPLNMRVPSWLVCCSSACVLFRMGTRCQITLDSIRWFYGRMVNHSMERSWKIEFTMVCAAASMWITMPNSFLALLFLRTSALFSASRIHRIFIS